MSNRATKWFLEPSSVFRGRARGRRCATRSQAWVVASADATIQEARGLPGLPAGVAESPFGTEAFGLCELARGYEVEGQLRVGPGDRPLSQFVRSATHLQFAGTATVGFKICRWRMSLQTVGVALPGCPARLERPARDDHRFSSALASGRADGAHAHPSDAAPSGVRDDGHLRRNRQALDEVLQIVPGLGCCFNRRFSSRLGPRPRAQGHQSKHAARTVVLLPEFSKRIG